MAKRSGRRIVILCLFFATVYIILSLGPSRDSLETSSVHSLASTQSAHSLASKQSVHSMTSKQSVHSMTSKQSVHSLASKQSVRSLPSKQSVHSLTSKQSVQSLTSNQSVQSLPSKKSLHSLTSKQSVQSLPSKQSYEHGLYSSKGIVARPIWVLQQTREKTGNNSSRLFFTHDDWPQFPKKPYNFPIPKSPFNPPYTIQWEFDTSAFLRRRDVKGKPPKLINWIARVGYFPNLPDPVRLRTCPEMPCRLTSNVELANQSAALIWNAQNIKKGHNPPERSHPDQVFVFHNQERMESSLEAGYHSTFYRPQWLAAFNWTFSFRTDADIFAPYGYVWKRPRQEAKDYETIVSRKTKKGAWLVSHCVTEGRREEFVKKLQEHFPVDVYGRCGPHKCARDKDDKCFETISKNYKFYFALENALCKDYITEKAFRPFQADLVLVFRGGEGCKKQLPAGTYINTDDFKSVKALADHLNFLDQNPKEYIKILQEKDRYQSMYEEYPHRNHLGRVTYIHYQYEAVPLCEMCRRLWDLNSYRKTVPNIRDWLERGNSVPPHDLN